MRSVKKRHDEYTKEIVQLQSENKALKVQVQQYGCKMHRLAHAAVDCNAHMHKAANAALEDGRVSPNDAIKSDLENANPCYYVIYYSTMELPMD